MNLYIPVLIIILRVIAVLLGIGATIAFIQTIADQVSLNRYYLKGLYRKMTWNPKIGEFCTYIDPWRFSGPDEILLIYAKDEIHFKLIRLQDSYLTKVPKKDIYFIFSKTTHKKLTILELLFLFEGTNDEI